MTRDPEVAFLREQVNIQLGFIEKLSAQVAQLSFLVVGADAPPPRPTLTVLAGDSKPSKRRRRAPKLRLVNGGAA